jgi:hypothetical protein
MLHFPIENWVCNVGLLTQLASAGEARLAAAQSLLEELLKEGTEDHVRSRLAGTDAIRDHISNNEDLDPAKRAQLVLAYC